MADFDKATAADAELVLKLYDLRREPVMREARKFISTFFPQSADDIMNIMNAMGTPENAYIRQVIGYWEMAASLVLRGALHEGLYLDNAQEMFFVFSKFAPHLAEVREKLGQPQAFARCEEVINHTSGGQQRLELMIERQRVMAARYAAQAGR